MAYIMLMYLGYMLDIGSVFWWMPCILGLSIRATFWLAIFFHAVKEE